MSVHDFEPGFFAASRKDVSDNVRAHHMFSRILKFLFVIGFFFEKEIVSLLKIITVILAFLVYVFQFLDENPFTYNRPKQTTNFMGKNRFP